MIGKWVNGRQVVLGDTSYVPYKKLRIFQSKRFKFDLYLIKIFPLMSVPWHFDKTFEGYEHHRLNITWSGAYDFFLKVGGKRMKVNRGTRFLKFRPDIVEHSASTRDGCLLLSIGWLKKKKELNKNIF